MSYTKLGLAAFAGVAAAYGLDKRGRPAKEDYGHFTVTQYYKEREPTHWSSWGYLIRFKEQADWDMDKTSPRHDKALGVTERIEVWRSLPDGRSEKVYSRSAKQGSSARGRRAGPPKREPGWEESPITRGEMTLKELLDSKAEKGSRVIPELRRAFGPDSGASGDKKAAKDWIFNLFSQSGTGYVPDTRLKRVFPQAKRLYGASTAKEAWRELREEGIIERSEDGWVWEVEIGLRGERGQRGKKTRRVGWTDIKDGDVVIRDGKHYARVVRHDVRQNVTVVTLDNGEHEWVYRDGPGSFLEIEASHGRAAQSRRSRGRKASRKHKLMTAELRRKLPAMYANENVKDPIVHAKYFTPYGNAYWLITEYDGEDTMFGWAELFAGEGELGYVSLSELDEAVGGEGLLRGVPMVERDLYFNPQPLSEAKRREQKSRGFAARGQRGRRR